MDYRATVESVRKRISSLNGIIAMVGVLALIIGLFVGSPVGRIICGVILLGTAAGLWRRLRPLHTQTHDRGDVHRAEDVPSHSSEEQMKKLLFDDFQSAESGSYRVKDVREEEKVIPSTKSVKPATAALRDETVRELEIMDFFDMESDDSIDEAEPRNEFHTLLNKVLLVLKDVLFGHSVAFFWANREKHQMVLEAMASDSQNFMEARRFTIEDDIVSQVAKTGKPFLLGQMDPVSEKELIPFYQSPENIRSVVCVPVYFFNGTKDQLPVAVIVVDSKAADAFGQETLGTLGRFTKLVSRLIKSYTDKYDLLLESELLNSIRRMHDRIKSDPVESTVLTAAAEEANRLVNWDCLSIVMYADTHHGWVLQKVVNRTGQPYVTPDQLIDFDDSIVGKVIKTNQVQVVDDMASHQMARFYRAEKIESSGAFLCLPISSLNRCYGALALESKTKANFTGIEVETIYRLVENAAAMLEVLYMNDLVKEFVIVDQLTGCLTEKYFKKKIEEEVRRAEDFGTDLTQVSIAVDRCDELVSRYGKDGLDAIVNELVKIMRNSIRPYDVIGRSDPSRTGVLLIQTAASDAYVWAEKIRKQIASHIIGFGGKSFSVTVSIGVCGLTEGMLHNELMASTAQVLGKAMESGGNLVRIY